VHGSKPSKQLLNLLRRLFPNYNCRSAGQFSPTGRELGQGDGTFVSGGSPALPLGDLQIADLNGDGKLDLATVSVDNAGHLTLHIALGNGGGSFQPPLALSAGQYPFPSGWISLADFNNDGRLDVAISGSLNQYIPSPSIVLVQTPAK
jgi:hypothetical protein